MPDDIFMAEGRASARPVFAKQDMQKHVPPGAAAAQRKHPIHLPPGEGHNRANIIFVTTCTGKKRTILASPNVHDTVISAARYASTRLVRPNAAMPADGR